jgi:hypothetical protein
MQDLLYRPIYYLKVNCFDVFLMALLQVGTQPFRVFRATFYGWPDLVVGVHPAYLPVCECEIVELLMPGLI